MEKNIALGSCMYVYMYVDRYYKIRSKVQKAKTSHQACGYCNSMWYVNLSAIKLHIWDKKISEMWVTCERENEN